MNTSNQSPQAFGLGSSISKVAAVVLWTAAIGMVPASAEAPPTVAIPLPQGESIEFVAIYLGIDGGEAIAARSVMLGSREGSFREWLTDVSLAGSFVGAHPSRKELEWCYYLAKTEITEAQWASLMGGEGAGSRLPKTGVSIAEISLFVERLNAHFLRNERNRLPTLRRQLAFCRLPTEAEFEFAARGGTEVEEVVFDRAHPYDDLASHEWYLGTSGGNLRPVGQKPANPAGLHDMLGNAAEITQSVYSLEYGAGRIGGLVVRGGRANDKGVNIRASMREEFLPYNDKLPPLGEPRRDRRIGFRMALSTPIFGPGFRDEELRGAWDVFVKNRPQGAEGRSSQIVREAEYRAERDRLATKIAALEGELQAGKIPAKPVPQPDVQIEAVAALKAKLAQAERERDLIRVEKNKLFKDNRDLAAENLNSERKKVYALIRTASSQSHLIYLNHANYLTKEKMRKQAERDGRDEAAKKYAQAARAKEVATADCVRLYRRDLLELVDSSKVLIAEQLAAWRKELKGFENSVQQQKAMDALEEHIKLFQAERKFPDNIIDDVMRRVDAPQN